MRTLDCDWNISHSKAGIFGAHAGRKMSPNKGIVIIQHSVDRKKVILLVKRLFQPRSFPHNLSFTKYKTSNESHRTPQSERIK